MYHRSALCVDKQTTTNRTKHFLQHFTYRITYHKIAKIDLSFRHTIWYLEKLEEFPFINIQNIYTVALWNSKIENACYSACIGSVTVQSFCYCYEISHFTIISIHCSNCGQLIWIIVETNMKERTSYYIFASSESACTVENGSIK